ncbi:MAG: hybrid sensor histidine kinase/response regulator, partial [Gammaproteobacteria bacterium]|nr:hybrid sensor histidine kinase/response regulator [Gammaproteobacteria bacterium]
MIDDEEMRGLFKIEGTEHLQALDDGLLRLEKSLADKALLEELLRAAHSLKGAARMLGVDSVETLAHRMEDILRAAFNDETPIDAEAIERLTKGLHALRAFVEEAITDAAPGITIAEGLAQLDSPAAGQAIPPPAAPEREETVPPKPESQEAAPTSEQAPASTNPVPAQAPLQVTAPYRIDTIRVETRRLDELMTHLAELIVVKNRIGRHLVDVDALLELWEEWHREASGLTRPGTVLSSAQLEGYLTGETQRLERLGSLAKGLVRTTQDYSARLDMVSDRLAEGVQSIRLLPLATVFELFPRMVRDLAKTQAKEVELHIEGGDTTVDKGILEEVKDPLMHMLRNAIDHGIETPDERERSGKPRGGVIDMKARHADSHVLIEVSDDGKGLDLDAIRKAAVRRKLRGEQEIKAMSDAQVQALIFEPGLSTSGFITELSGRGVGLDVVRTNVEQLKGELHVNSTPGAGTTLRLRLPLSLATTRVLTVTAGGRIYGIPVEAVQQSRLILPGALFPVEGSPTMDLDGQPVSVMMLTELLELEEGPQTSGAPEGMSGCVILEVAGECYGVLVEELLDEQEVVIKPHGALLRRVRNVIGASILETGTVCMVLNPFDLAKSIRKHHIPAATEALPGAVGEARRPVVLLVEDQITTRTQEKRILEGAGYEVVVAVDGVEALGKLASQSVD